MTTETLQKAKNLEQKIKIADELLGLAERIGNANKVTLRGDDTPYPVIFLQEEDTRMITAHLKMKFREEKCRLEDELAGL